MGQGAGRARRRDQAQPEERASSPWSPSSASSSPQIFSGTVIIESIFGLPGMGRFLFDAILQRDYPVIQGINLVIVSIIVLMNLLVDMLYAVLDPRIRYY